MIDECCVCVSMIDECCVCVSMIDECCVCVCMQYRCSIYCTVKLENFVQNQPCLNLSFRGEHYYYKVKIL